MKDKGHDSSYKHFYKKDKKSFAKLLDIGKRIGQNSQPRSLAASQPRSLAASQPRSLAAEGFLCSNKTIKHKQIFSHKKPHNGRSTLLCFFYITPFKLKYRGGFRMKMKEKSGKLLGLGVAVLLLAAMMTRRL